MAFPYTPLWTFLQGYFVSTSCDHESVYKTMVFPSGHDAKKVTIGFTDQVEGVDFIHPINKYTRYYASIDAAKTGHKETVKKIKEFIKNR